MIDQIQPLTQQQRVQARKQAIEVVVALAGKKPAHEQFRNSTISKYPHWITGIVVGLSLIVLLTAFLLSAMRLYHIGYATFHANSGSIFVGVSGCIRAVSQEIRAVTRIIATLFPAIYDFYRKGQSGAVI